MIKDKNLLKIKEVIKNIFPDCRIILFGSRSRNDFNSQSDYDILVIINNNMEVKEKRYYASIIMDKLAEMEILTDVIVRTEKDIDYYKIINDTYFDINCNLIISKANDNYSTFLYDENFNLISKINDNLPFKLISKKIYYIKVNSKNSDFSDLPYTIIVKPSTNINDLTEYEPNNKLENASRIELNKVLFGKILENDIDFYTFNIEKEGFYKIIFTSSNFPFSISFISDFGTFYSDYKMHRAGSFSHLLLPKGTYYIKVNNIEKSKNNSFSYSIKLEKDSPSIEIEPNDLESQANEWTIFDIISGSISWEYDVDYYYIQFEKKENNIIISTEDPFSILRCEIFVDNILTSSFDIKEGTTNILVNGEKVLIKLSSLNFTKEIVYTIKVGN